MKSKLQIIVDNLIDGAIELVAPLTSILALYIPASMTFYSTQEQLDFTIGRAFITALVVEFTGLSAITDSLKYWRHNKKYSYTYKNRNSGIKETRISKAKKAPFQLAFGVAIFYFVLLLVLNISLESAINDTVLNFQKLIAKITLVLIALPNVLLIAGRYTFNEILSEIPKVSTKVESPKKSERNFPKDFRKLSEKQRNFLKDKTAQEIAKLVGVSERTGYNWLHSLNNGHYVATQEKKEHEYI